jgi:transcriptional regulator with XRE-family HTH domain
VSGPVGPDRPAPSAEPPLSFANWFAGRLRREALTMEAAARRLDVSAKTISRWVSGSTEPRLRDLLRIRDIFGDPPIH